jgi:hypothetical protein
MTRGASLLEVVQALLERTYRMRTGIGEIAPFVIGDTGYRSLYGHRVVVGSPFDTTAGARTLVRDAGDGIRVCIYYPDLMIRLLESHPPQKGLREENVDAFATLVEEADHFLCIAERAMDLRPLTLFELELHANVSKHLVLARFLRGSDRVLDPRRREWLHWHLFHKGTPCDEDPDVRARYRDATRFALRFLDRVFRCAPAERISALRRFHAASAGGKLELIAKLAA